MAIETRYAISGDVHIAYQVLGGGQLDLLFVWRAGDGSRRRTPGWT
jgi:hypothetical protein